MSNYETIVVTGATGKLGRLVIAELRRLAPTAHLVGLVRDAEKAADLNADGVELRVASYVDAASVTAALAGADKLLLISSSEVGQRAVQHRNVVNAAASAGVKLLAYTSILHAETNPLALASEHLTTETDIRASGVPFVLLRNGWYTENYTVGIAQALEHGAVLGASREGRISTAARIDYAAAAAVVLAGDVASYTGRTYELAGDDAFTLAQLTAEITRQSGRQVEYRDLPEAEYKAALQQAGLPAVFAGILANSSAKAADGALYDDSRQLSTLIGRSTTPLASAVAQALAVSSAAVVI